MYAEIVGKVIGPMWIGLSLIASSLTSFYLLCLCWALRTEQGVVRRSRGVFGLALAAVAANFVLAALAAGESFRATGEAAARSPFKSSKVVEP